MGHILRVFARRFGIGVVLSCTVLRLEGQNVPPEWIQPQTPFRIFGNTYYVGTRGLSSILITSELILNSHVHYDHAGGISAAAEQKPAVQAHFTGGHTPGGTSWSWKSCEGSACIDASMRTA